jgi:hypothetical protein
MDSKFYVSLEAARLLKEKGYNEKVEKAYATMNNGTTIKVLQVVHNNKELPELCYSCPTKAEAIDWLESKGIVVEAFYLRFEQEWFYDVFVLSTRESYTSDDLHSRLEAEEAAIIKALELL